MLGAGNGVAFANAAATAFTAGQGVAIANAAATAFAAGNQGAAIALAQVSGRLGGWLGPALMLSVTCTAWLHLGGPSWHGCISMRIPRSLRLL